MIRRKARGTYFTRPSLQLHAWMPTFHSSRPNPNEAVSCVLLSCCFEMRKSKSSRLFDVKARTARSRAIPFISWQGHAGAHELLTAREACWSRPQCYAPETDDTEELPAPSSQTILHIGSLM